MYLILFTFFYKEYLSESFEAEKIKQINQNYFSLHFLN